LSPSPEYAPPTVRFPARNSATIKLTHHPIVTLLDAGNCITGLPKADQQLDEWQTAPTAESAVA